MRIALSGVALAAAIGAACQPVPSAGQGRVEVLEPWSVTHLLQRHAEFIEEIETIEGYRVQLVASSDLDVANEVKAKALTRFRQYKTYLDFFSPYYKVRVGDFRTKLEAYRCLKDVQSVFPDAYIVMDMIEIKEL